MKTSKPFRVPSPARPGRVAVAGVMTLFLLLGSLLRAAEAAQNFATPEAAVTALADAVRAANGPAVHALLGPGSEDLVNADQVQGENELAAFAAAYAAENHLVHDSESRCTLIVGRSGWPFPIPLVRTEGRWAFDVAAGRDELLNRRIGRNELATLKVMRAYVLAQREYATRDRDGDQVLEFAQKLSSSPGTKDGLYWPMQLDGEISPLGPLVARAQNAGYGKNPEEKPAPRPFQGYLFKILTRQGKSAPGGEYDYVINGNMIAGFALVAWPAAYGDSGIMTFIVNQQGRVYQRDLGPETAQKAPALTTYDPDDSWSVSAD